MPQVLLLVMALGAQSVPPPPVQPQQVVLAQVVARPATPQKIYNETADAKAQVEAAIRAAATDGIRVLINWGANDDEGCTKFAAALRTPVVTRTRYSADEYKVVNVDVGLLDKNLALAKTYGAKLVSGALPALTVLDDRGKAIAQASAAEFISAADPSAIDPGKVAAFFTKHQAPPPPDAGPVFEEAVKRARHEGKYVFVWFSAPW